MLRLRKNKWGNVLFDAWVVAFTGFTTFLFIRTNEYAHKNRELINANRALSIRVSHVSKKADHLVCIRINNLNIVVTQTLQRSKTNLPRVAYFKEHPEELASQLKEINRELILFKPRACGKGVK